MLVGPFTGEVGYELLYWLPFVRRFLREHEVAPERVTVMTRGGAGAWYRDVAAHELDVLDVVTPEALRGRVAERERARGDLKQLEPDAFDDELVCAVGARIGTQPAVVHPRFMYARTRFVWEGLEPPARALDLGDYAALPEVAERLPEQVASLPRGAYMAVKAYFNDCLPDTAEVRAALGELVGRLAERHDVVLLSTGLELDDHAEWTGAGAVLDLAGELDPRTNLAVQTAVVGRARALVCTYGGFSYLGPYLDVPTVSLAAVDEPNRRHEDVARAAFPNAAYARVAPDAAEATLLAAIEKASAR